jgi:predicted ATPase
LEALSREEGFQLWSAATSILRGWVLSEQGQLQEGIELMRRSIEAWRATGAEVCFPYYLSLLAGAYGKAGRPEDGLALVDESLSISTATGETWWKAELIRLKGHLTLLSPGDNRRSAETCFREAIHLARRQSAKLLELRATVSLGRLLAGQGRSAEARQMLVAIYGWFEEGLDTPDLMEANALLAEIRSLRYIPNLADNEMRVSADPGSLATRGCPAR